MNCVYVTVQEQAAQELGLQNRIFILKPSEHIQFYLQVDSQSMQVRNTIMLSQLAH